MSLYEQDFHVWVSRHVELLKQGRFADLDVENLIEELEAMAGRDRHELISRLIILLAHLLKWQFQPGHRGRSWENSIAEQRVQIAEQFEYSPSLKNYLHEAITKAYPKAIKLAVRETRLAISTFPEVCPYVPEQVLNEDFYPPEKN